MMSDEITVITPTDYVVSKAHRDLAHELVERAGVNIHDVAIAEKLQHGWRLRIYKRRRRRGRFYIVRGEIAGRWVNVPGQTC